MIGVETTRSYANAKRQWYSLVSQRYGKQCPKNAVTDPQFSSLGSSVVCLRGVDQMMVAIKPEHLLDPLTERCALGGRSLTLMTAHM